MSRVRWLERGLVSSPVYLALCRSEQALQRELRRLRIPAKDWPQFLGGTASASTMIFSNSDDETACIVCIGDVSEDTPTRVAALLVHEAVHVWQEVKRVMGETDPSSEFEAYSVQSISQKLFDAFVESEQ